MDEHSNNNLPALRETGLAPSKNNSTKNLHAKRATSDLGLFKTSKRDSIQGKTISQQHIVGDWKAKNFVTDMGKQPQRLFEYSDLNLNDERFNMPRQLPKIVTREKRVIG